MKHLIVNSPSVLSLKVHLRDRVFFYAFWTLCIYLIIPIISLSLWVKVFSLLYGIINDSVSDSTIQKTAIAFLLEYGIMVCFILSTLSGWSYINQRQFRRGCSRKTISETNMEVIADAFRVAPDIFQALSTAQRITFHHDADAAIFGVELGCPLAHEEGKYFSIRNTFDDEKSINAT